MLAQFRHEGLEEPDGNLVGARIVVAVFREVTFDLVVDDQTGFVADCGDLGVLDRAEGIDDMGEPGNARGEGPAHVRVDQGHLGCLIVVFVVHVLDEVQDIHVESGQPVHHLIEAMQDLIVVKHV